MGKLTDMFFLSMLSADPPAHSGCMIADDVEDPPDWDVQDVEGDEPNCDGCPIEHICDTAYQPMVVEVAYDPPRKRSKLLERLIKKNNGG
jgi:hypothetical protein